MGSKHISKKIEIVTKVLGGVGEITKCHNFHTLKYAEDIKIKEYTYFSGFFKFKWCLNAY